MPPVPAAVLLAKLEGTFLCVPSCPRATAPPRSARALGLGEPAPNGARKGRVREPRPEAEVQQFAESGDSEASQSPTPGQVTAMDPGQDWNRGSGQPRAAGE